MNLNRQSVKFMRHELTASGLRPDARKIEAVQRMPPPVDRNGVLRLLGMATYLAKFCPSFSEATAPLRELATKDTEFVWDEARHDTALQKLKDLLSAAPVLQYYDVSHVAKPMTVQCDASQGGLGAVIMQDGKLVEYASRALSRVERTHKWRKNCSQSCFLWNVFTRACSRERLLFKRIIDSYSLSSRNR